MLLKIKLKKRGVSRKSTEEVIQQAAELTNTFKS